MADTLPDWQVDVSPDALSALFAEGASLEAAPLTPASLEAASLEAAEEESEKEQSWRMSKEARRARWNRSAKPAVGTTGTSETQTMPRQELKPCDLSVGGLCVSCH